MEQLFSSLPAIILVLALLALLVYSGTRIGPRFLVKRLAGLAFVIVGVSFVTFILGYISPGSPALAQCGEKCTAQFIASVNHFYGLDLPWYEQYGRFLNNLIHLSLGDSYTLRGRSVLDIMGSGVPISAQLGLAAVTLQILIGVPIGLVAAVRAGTRYDTASMATALILFSIPTFITIPLYQLIMIHLYQAGLPSLPVSGWGDPIDAIAPITLLTLVGMGFFARLTRTAMLDVLRQDYVRTARAKGLGERIVIIRHAFRNALVPIVTAIGPAVAFVVGGAFFTERFFNIPGIGFYAVSSIDTKDLPVIQGTVILVAIAVAIMNLVVDIAYGLLDPRIKVS